VTKASAASRWPRHVRRCSADGNPFAEALAGGREHQATAGRDVLVDTLGGDLHHEIARRPVTAGEERAADPDRRLEPALSGG
jgi:hypothetical protein